MIELTRDGAVFVLRLCSGENRFNPTFIAALDAALDEVERSTGEAALVTIGTEEKYFSNGLDLAWMGGQDRDQTLALVRSLMRLLGRLLAFPVPSVAAVNGHAFAGGAMFALAHDWRLMRADRGFLCVPEIDLRMPLAPGMVELFRLRMTPTVFRDAILTGVRWGAPDCVARQIVDEVVALPDLLPRAVERAAQLAKKDRHAYSVLKRCIYGEAIALLETARLPAGMEP